MANFVEMTDSDVLSLPILSTVGTAIHGISPDPVTVARHANPRELTMLLALVTHPDDPDRPHVVSLHPDLFQLTNAAVKLHTGRRLKVCGSDGYRVVVEYPGRG